MLSAVACGLDPSSYLLPFGWNDALCRVAGPLLPGFQPSLVSSLYALSALQVSVVVLIHWPPSARLLSGSVMAVAVTAVFYATQRGLVLLLSAVAGWFPHLPSWPFGYLSQCAE